MKPKPKKARTPIRFEATGFQSYVSGRVVVLQFYGPLPVPKHLVDEQPVLVTIQPIDGKGKR